MSAARGGARDTFWLLTCEHASYAVPRAYRSLGVSRHELRDQIKPMVDLILDKAGQNLSDAVNPPQGPVEAAGRKVDRAIGN